MFASLGRLAWTEILGWARRRSLYVVLAGLVALILVSVAVGADDLTSRRQAYADQLASIAREQVKPRLPMTGTTVERVLRVPRPPELGSIVARGEDVRLSPYFDFGPAGLLWGSSVVTDAAQMQAGALFDIESILRVLGGLIAMLLGIEVIGTSRFRGQLHAWQALGLSPPVAVSGKVLGCFGILAAGAVVVLGVVFVSASLRLPDEPFEIASILAASLVPVGLYLFGLGAAGAAVALWSRTLAAASVAGVAVWATVAMIGPQVAGLAGHLLAPAMPRAEFERARDQVHSEDTRAAEEALGGALEGALAKWSGRVPTLALDAAVSNHKAALESIWISHVQAARESARQVERGWMDTRNRQAAIDDWSKVVTPGASLIGAVTALAGTGPGLTRAWYENGEVHQRQLTEAVFDNRSLATVRYRGQITEHVRHRTLKWSDLPGPPPIVLGSRWREAARTLLALVAYLALASLLTMIGARRLASAR